jgi:hypothetical protein
MHLSKSMNFPSKRFCGMQSTAAMPALHPERGAAERVGLFVLTKQLMHGIGLAAGSRKSGCATNYSNRWRQIMFTLMPSMGVGFMGSLLTAIAMAADWYIWNFRYRLWRTPLAPPLKGRADVIHVPGASGRELVVNPAPQSADWDVASLHQVDREWLDALETPLSVSKWLAPVAIIFTLLTAMLVFAIAVTV